MGLLLFVVAILGDFAAIWFRYWVGSTLGGPMFGYVLAFAPQMWSLLTLLGLPSGNLLTRWELGAREPSERERLAVEPVVTALVAETNARGPRRWYVLDEPFVEAAVAGTTLFVNRALIDTPHLQPVIAHELGHLNSLDGRLTLALQHTVFPGGLLLLRFFDRMAQRTTEWGIDPRTGRRVELRRQARGGAVGCVGSVGVIASFVFMGGLPLIVLNLLRVLPAYWRVREYAADAYAAKLGEAGPLADTLDELRELDVATPWLPWSTRTHPYTELRIDRLLRLARGEQVTTLAGRAGTAFATALLGAVLVPILGCWYVSVGLGALRPGGVDTSVASTERRTAVAGASGETSATAEAAIADASAAPTEGAASDVGVAPNHTPTTLSATATSVPTPTTFPTDTPLPAVQLAPDVACGPAEVVNAFAGLGVRRWPNRNAERVGQTEIGTTVDILCDVAAFEGAIETWRKVEVGNTIGWVQGRFLEPTGDARLAPPTSGAAVEPTCGVVLVDGTTSGLSIRAAPEQIADVRERVNEGGTVEVVCDAAPEGEWRRVRAGDVTGWARAEFLRFVPGETQTSTGVVVPTVGAAGDDVCATARITGEGALSVRAQPTRQSAQLGAVGSDGVVKIVCRAFTANSSESLLTIPLTNVKCR